MFNVEAGFYLLKACLRQETDIRDRAQKSLPYILIIAAYTAFFHIVADNSHQIQC